VTSLKDGIVLPGIGSHSPFAQSRMSDCAISAAVSCASGDITRSSTGSGRWRIASSAVRSAIPRNRSQSDRDSQAGGTASESGWMKECMSVVLRSAFSYQVAAGSTTSE
jgi:hypothetical protein